jgi:hypothetical protein
MDNFEGKWGDKLCWDELIQWYVDNMTRFYSVVYPYWEEAQKR